MLKTQNDLTILDYIDQWKKFYDTSNREINNKDLFICPRHGGQDKVVEIYEYRSGKDEDIILNFFCDICDASAYVLSTADDNDSGVFYIFPSDPRDFPGKWTPQATWEDWPPQP